MIFSLKLIGQKKYPLNLSYYICPRRCRADSSPWCISISKATCALLKLWGKEAVKAGFFPEGTASLILKIPLNEKVILYMLIDSVQRAIQLLKLRIKKENQGAGWIISGFVERKSKITVKENATQSSLENSFLSYPGLREGIQWKKRRLVFVTSLIMSDRLVCQHKMWNSKHFKAYKKLINGCCKQSLWGSWEFNFLLCPCFYFHSISEFKFIYTIYVVANKSVQLGLGSISSVSKYIEIHFCGPCTV